ncbi:MAG: hypothetical protein NHB15_21255 [Methanosarcina barkeri]|nr:hypothetical protein [Methanosarcina sp. ERenArc_MAG2]
MPPESKNPDPFKQLKWSDLQDWAGGKATAKGIKYQEEERVKEIKRTSEGSLVALVEGTTEYFTEVSLENGKLSSICTCPVGHNCKHGVAAVLEYLERIEQGKKFRLLPRKTRLLQEPDEDTQELKFPRPMRPRNLHGLSASIWNKLKNRN